MDNNTIENMDVDNRNDVLESNNQLDYLNGISTKFDAYSGEENFIFISYSHLDSDKVYPILDELYDRKYRIWYDESCETGNDFRDELRDKIEKCEAVIVFVSENSMNSPFCGMEIIVARENGKRLYPIYLTGNEVVPPTFSILFGNTHHGVASDMKKLIKSLLRDLPASTMDRLTVDGYYLKKCENNGEKIEVDEGIKVICSEAFKKRNALRNISLPDSLEIIENEGLRGCEKLESITIPENVIRIGESAFRDCVNLNSLIFKGHKVKIGERSFENCTNLSHIVLPDQLTEIYGGVFNSCRSLEKIVLPEELMIIGESAFSDCVGLKEIFIPESVTKIDDLVFNGCIELSKVEMHEGLKKIGKNAFKNCHSLVNITIPASVTNIGESPFRGCESLKSIQVNSSNKRYKSAPTKRDGSDYVLFNKNKSTLIAYPASSREVQYDIPDSVTVIKEWAFCGAKKLNRIIIPDSVNSIEEGAFCNCVLLDELVIPDSVTKLDDCVFRGCTSLEKVTIPSSVVEMGWGIFDGCEDIVTVFCDEGSEAQKYCISNGIQEARIEQYE